MSFESTWGVSLPEAAEELDEELRVVDSGRVRCTVALWAAFYFRDGDTPEVRERVVEVWERYRAAVGDVLVWGADPKTQRPKKVRGTPILDVRGWMSRVPRHSAFEPEFKGGVKKEDASPYRFSALASKDVPEDLSTVAFSLPLSWPASRPQGAYLSLVHQVATCLRPVHGYAGLGLTLPPTESGTGEDVAFAVPLAKRFRGLELDFPYLQAGDLEEGIKGVNWLTALEDAWVEKLGGLDALRQALGDDNPVHVYPGGILIQAGPHPLFGDVNRAEPMPHYEKVAAVLKPIRVTEMRAIAHWSGLDRDQTAEWLARFDV